MKNLRKALAAVIALTVMSVSASAFAEISATGSFSGGNGAVTADYTNIASNTVVATVDTTLATTGTQMTFLVLDNGTDVTNIDESDILYIDQKELTANGNSFTGVINLARVAGAAQDATELPAGSYPIRVGYYYDDNGVQTFGLAAATMVVEAGGEAPKITVKWGDITLDAEIDVADALAALYYAAGTPRSYPSAATETIEANQFTVGNAVGDYLWGDITLDTEIDVADALAALYYAAGTPRTYEDVTVGSDVEITLAAE